MPVQVDLDGIRQVGPDLDESGSPLRVLEIEVVVVDCDRVPGKGEVDPALRLRDLLSAKRGRFLLGDTDEDDTLSRWKPRPVRRSHSILPLAAFKMDEGHLLRAGKTLDGSDETVMERREQSRRGNRIAQLIPQEDEQLAAGLQCGDVPVEIDPIKTLDSRHSMDRVTC